MFLALPNLDFSMKASTRIGETIADKYRIEEVIGQGGMSIVYRARHLSLDNEVALKVLSPAALLVPEYVTRLEREARAASRIRSQHVARVHDIGKMPDGAPFLVMEHLEGSDLAGVLAKRGPLSVELAIMCILQACDAIAEAHAMGVTHRDLKPANLFMTDGPDGMPCVKVLDFGIARSRRGALSPLTDPGVVLGTPSYMAPEQMEGSDKVDARADIWALGTILFELLAGRVPCAGEQLPKIFIEILRSKPPRLSSLRDDIPAALDEVVARCLAIEPDHRYQSVAELAWALAGAGAPKDAAIRIERVLDRGAARTDAAVTSRVPAVRPFRLAKRRSSKRTFLTASALIVGAAVGFAVLSYELPRRKAAPTVDPVADSVAVAPQ